LPTRIRPTSSRRTTAATTVSRLSVRRLRSASTFLRSFGSALPKLAVGVDAREPEIAIRQLRQTVERVVGGRRPGANGLEQVAKIVPKPAHGAIVR